MPLETPTFGGPNAGPKVGEVNISEVHFNPADPDGGGRIQPRDLEFIEVTNRFDRPIDLTGWQLAGDVAYTFPDGMILSANDSAIIVSFDPTAGDGKSKRSVLEFMFGMSPTDTVLGPLTNPEDARAM